MADFLNSIQSQSAADLMLEQAKLQSIQRPLKNHENKEDLKKAAQQFEGVFINQLLTSMDKTIDREDSMFEDDSAQDTFRGMFYDKVAEEISTRRGGSGLGLADAIYRQLIARLPEDQQTPPVPQAYQDEPIQLRPLSHQEKQQ